MELVVSDCCRSKKEEVTLKNMQPDVANGIYEVSKEEMDILNVAQQKRHEIQHNYSFGDSDTVFRMNISTSNSDSHNNQHTKEIQAMEQVLSDCRPSKIEEETLKNIKLRKINQQDVANGIYVVLKEEMDILKKHNRNDMRYNINMYMVAVILNQLQIIRVGLLTLTR